MHTQICLCQLLLSCLQRQQKDGAVPGDVSLSASLSVSASLSLSLSVSASLSLSLPLSLPLSLDRKNTRVHYTREKESPVLSSL